MVTRRSAHRSLHAWVSHVVANAPEIVLFPARAIGTFLGRITSFLTGNLAPSFQGSSRVSHQPAPAFPSERGMSDRSDHMRKLIFALLIAAPLLALESKPAAACGWGSGSGYGYTAPRNYGYYGYTPRSYGYYGYAPRRYGYYGYAPRYYGGFYGRRWGWRGYGYWGGWRGFGRRAGFRGYGVGVRAARVGGFRGGVRAGRR